MATTGTKATTHNALRGTEVVMARRSFFSVVFVSSDSGAVTESRTFTTKRAAAKFAAWFVGRGAEMARVMEGGAGGCEVARFTK